MSYIHIATGRYPLSSADIRAAHANTSLPGDAAGFEAALPDLGYAVVAQVPEPAVNYTKNVSEGEPELKNGTYRQRWIVSDATPAEVTQRTAAQAGAIRQQRNDLLSGCDWTQLADAPAGSTAWCSYRQQLRDVSKQPGFPWQVAWPKPPSQAA